MTTEEQSIKPTLGEEITELYSRVAKLNDITAALLNPNWGASAGIIPEGHPLHPAVVEALPSCIVKRADEAQEERAATTNPAAVPAAVSVPPPTRADDRAALRDRIAQAIADALKPRYGGPQHNTPGGLPLTATAEEVRLHRAQPLADAVLAVLPPPADRAATSVCICGHPKQQHFEDVCITEITGCNCGDYLEPEAAAEVIDRWRQAAIQARAEGLTDAADFVRGLLLTRTGITTAGLEAELRRMADEAQQQADTAAAIARVRAVADGLERDADAPGVVEIVRPALRDAARQIRAALPAVGAQQKPGTETHEDLPARLEAALTERFTELGNPFSEMRRHEQGPDGWPASHPVGPAKVAEVLRELLAVAPPAVGPGRVADEEPTTQTQAQEPETEEQVIRDHVTRLHLIGEQLADLEFWMWEHLANVRDAERQQPETQAAHSCKNCLGIDPDTCLMNPERPRG